MSPSKETGLEVTAEIDPVAPLEHLLQWLVGAALHVALGLLIGLLAARLMRRLHLHWSWAAAAFALVLFARAALAADARTTLGAATLAAALRGRRWHGEDIQAGADLGAIAAERTTPLDGLRAGARAASSMLASTLAPGPGERLWRGGQLSVGVDRRGRSVSIELGGAGLARRRSPAASIPGPASGAHTLVVGATGAGKTFTQAWIATLAIAHGMAAVVVDPKGDRGLRERLRRAAHAAGKHFYTWTPEGPAVYNPFAHGGATEIADKALAGERFTEPHYQRQAQRYLGHAVRALQAAGREVSLAGIVRTLDPVELEMLARGLEPHRAQAAYAYLDGLTARQRSELSGVRDRLAIMAESDVGRWLDPTTPDAEAIDLLRAVRSGAVVHFSIDADSRPLLAQMLGAAIVQDLQTVVSALQSRPVGCLVMIDEFSAIAAKHVAGLFARARSAGISLLLGTQELADLRLHDREMLQEQVLGNLTSLIAHRQTVPASAELIARLSGGKGAWRTTIGSDGRHTRTRVSEHVIKPEEVMGLPQGVAAVIRLASPRSATIARIHSTAEDQR